MNVINGIENYNNSSKSILTIGTFDGVHLGHQKIITSLIANAKHQKLQANILTFFPHPRMVLQKETDLKLIDTLKVTIFGDRVPESASRDLDHDAWSALDR